MEKIKRHYENYDEEGRLFRDNAHLPEYLTTIRYFNQLLKPNSQILDAYTGAGRYSFYLADKVHHIGTDGLVYADVNKLNIASDENFHKYMEFHYSIYEAPDVVGASLHGLWIGRKT